MSKEATTVNGRCAEHLACRGQLTPAAASEDGGPYPISVGGTLF
jgi:hypothetical protein